MSETKICSKCGRELPATVDYYFRQTRLKCGLTAACKECMGGRFTDKDLKPNEDHKLCSRCKRELPATLEYFRANKKNQKHRLMDCCRKCQDEYNHQYKLANKEHIAEYGRA